MANLKQLLEALREGEVQFVIIGGMAAVTRGAPPGLPFRLDMATIRAGLNFTLTTTAGDPDLIGEVAGPGTYEGVLAHSEPRTFSASLATC